MRSIAALSVLIVLALCAGAQQAKAASTTNFTDQWWVANESGWGAAATQQSDIIFIDVFVYGADSRPTWFTAAASLQGTSAQGHVIFAGDLYATTGPYFAGAFNPTNVTNRKVGTLTFDADSVDTAHLTYSVDGIVVSKSVTRQLWRFENFSGNYYGGVIYDLSQCINPANNGHVEELGTLVITHNSDNTIAMTTQTTSSSCHFVANYTQAGHMGSMTGIYSCSPTFGGSFTAFEMEKTISGMTGRVVGQNNLCQFSGHFGGLLRQ